MFIDTHCHIHEASYALPLPAVLEHAREAGIGAFLSVGTSEESSRQAIAFSEANLESFAVIGVHPHDTKDGFAAIGELAETSNRIVGIGEIGLDYFYSHSPRDVQIKALKAQIQVALDHDFPISFHVRDAFDDFWPIFDSFPNIRGVLHSFTDSVENLQKALERGLYIGVNGISTFTKDEAQRAMFDSIPLNRLLLETDAPFLTPAPYRGKINEPAYVSVVAAYHANRRGVSTEDIAEATTQNARALFNLSALS